MFSGTFHAPMSNAAAPRTAPCAAAAGPAAAGPMTGARKAKTPPKASPASTAIAFNALAIMPPSPAALALCAAPRASSGGGGRSCRLHRFGEHVALDDHFRPFDEFDQKVLEHALERR